MLTIRLPIVGRVALALALTAALGCSSPTPEEQIRERIAEAQRAAEAHDVRAVRDFVSPDYSDEAGRDKEAIDGRIVFHFMRNRAVHLLIRIRSLRVVETGRAEVELLVATAASPIREPRALTNLDADLLRMDLELRTDAGGEWRVSSARWRRAGARDFF